ncbi:hypothetical protein HZA75_07310 [Candidatus Roizmanbacteria bacterium]|nr:hypothetical protein [Candidatus Roizmanbacteria bacterium]
MEFVSVNKIKIRLTGERLNHILTNHPEISEYVFDIGKTISSPDYLFEGNKGEHFAVLDRKVSYLVVIYREDKIKKDGFIITSFIIKRINYLLKKKQIWKKK